MQLDGIDFGTNRQLRYKQVFRYIRLGCNESLLYIYV